MMKMSVDNITFCLYLFICFGEVKVDVTLSEPSIIDLKVWLLLLNKYNYGFGMGHKGHLGYCPN